MKTPVFISILSLVSATRPSVGQINTTLARPISDQNTPKQVPPEPEWYAEDSHRPSASQFQSLPRGIELALRSIDSAIFSQPIESSRISQYDGETYENVEKGKHNFRGNKFEKKHDKKFIKAALGAHNICRKKHKVPALTYSQKVGKVSQAYADKLIVSLANGGPLVHNPQRKGYGENLWSFMSSPPRNMTDEDAVTSAVKAWYKEIKYYNQFFGREPDMKDLKNWGHFTQLVWKSSRQLGMGIARKKGYILIVANYKPAGNVVGKFAKNVNKPMRW
uniref:Golgi-associated plant pathogenesis-related protein 1 n=1 Tax=Cacopsylla melanoneura TaxID=428564 RepID=A0A8D8R681_9HEMI